MLEAKIAGRPTTLIGASSVGPRVLVVSSIQLDPPTHGNRARNRALVGALRRAGCEVHYLFWSTSSDEAYPAEAMQSLVDSGELVRARAPRALRNAQRLTRNAAHLLGRSGMLPANLWWALSGDRFSSTLCPTPLLARVRELLATRSFDAVIASYANLGPVAALAREHGALAIIDTHDILHERAEAIRTNGIFPSGTIIDRPQEARLLSQADLVLAIQSREARELAPLVGASRVMVVEHGMRMPDFVPMRPESGRALTLISSDNKQNQHGLEWFLGEVWPKILARVPDAVLEAHGPLSLRAECHGPNVRAHGIAADLSPIYAAATICINPIRAGSGLKIKSVEAMAHGRALVTTSVGADGLLPAMEDACCVADDPVAFADTCAALLLDPARAASLGLQAREMCESRFSADAVYAPLIARLRARRTDAATSCAAPTMSLGSTVDAATVGAPR
jgi:glycosyltransferase involved in cell wall biosynthesis